MSFFDKILEKFKLKSTYQMEYQQKIHPPKYLTEYYEQDSNQSITTGASYDFTRFSAHEAHIVKQVWNTVKQKYPPEYQSIGLANESYCIKYKPRYILFEIIICLYSKSDNPIDMFAVSLAYASKGAVFRKQALEYFEKSEDYIDSDLLDEFISCLPLHIYLMFSDLYEKEHLYEDAIRYTKLAKRFGEPSNSSFDTRIDMLKRKLLNSPRKVNRKVPDSKKKMEINITKAATFFIENNYLPSNMNNIQKTIQKPVRKMTATEYAIMCNAYLDHEDEMEQYKDQNEVTSSTQDMQ